MNFDACLRKLGTAYFADFHSLNKILQKDKGKSTLDADDCDELFFTTCEIFLRRQILTNTKLSPKIFGTNTICVFEFDDLTDLIESLFADTEFNFTLKDIIDFSHEADLYGTIGVRFKNEFRGLSTSTLSVNYVYEEFSRLNACVGCSDLLQSSKICKGCGIAKYGSPEHQKAHWKVHKHHCKRLIKEVD